jgi:hypothetical protein
MFFKYGYHGITTLCWLNLEIQVQFIIRSKNVKKINYNTITNKSQILFSDLNSNFFTSPQCEVHKEYDGVKWNWLILSFG